jgi:hypothetical protein
MTIFNVAHKLDDSKFFAAELRFFFENDVIRSFNVDQNVIQSLNMLHHVATNLRQNKLIVIRCLEILHFDVVHERERVMKHMIDDNFIDHSNELSHKIDRFHENRNHFHQIKRCHKRDHVSALFNQRQLIVFEKQVHQINNDATRKVF